MGKKVELDTRTRELVRDILEEVVNKLPKGYAITTKQLEDYVYKHERLKGNEYIKENSNYIIAYIGNFMKNNKLKNLGEQELINNIEDIFREDGSLPSTRKIIIKD